MIIRSIDSKNDWNFGAGIASYATYDTAIGISLAITLRTFLGECYFNPSVGVNWFQLINEKNKDYVLLNIKSAIAAAYGVLQVKEVSYNYTVDRVLTVTYDITTIYNNRLQGSVTI